MGQVKHISEIIRLPRLGKIRLGVKVQRKRDDGSIVEYPKATDYFVCPPEVQAVYGEKPTELRVAFPVEDERVFARQSYSCYSRSRGLLCRGNGETAIRLLDTATGVLPTEASRQVEMRPWTCHPKAEEGEENQVLCPEFTGEGYKAPQCRLLMQLQVLLPDVPGLGVWQIDTGSFWNTVGLNSCLAMLRSFTGGRVSMIPVRLLLGPEERQVEGKKKPVFLLHFIVPQTLTALLQTLKMPPLAAILPSPAEADRDLDVDGEEADLLPAKAPNSSGSETFTPAPAGDTDWDEEGWRPHGVPEMAAQPTPEVGLRQVLQDKLNGRWPDPETQSLFLEGICGKGVKTVEEVPAARLLEVIGKATPKARPKGN